MCLTPSFLLVEMESLKLFDQAGFEPQRSQPLPPEKLGLQA
jgi:hypothetical protein